jgi:hypothetical protein
MGEFNQTLKKAVDAYGGEETWAKAKFLSAEFSASGLAFILKQRAKFKRAKVAMDIVRPFCRITPIGRNPEITGALEGSDVYLEDASGKVL